MRDASPSGTRAVTSVLLVGAGFDHRADDTTGGSATRGDGCGRSEPARRHDRTEARNRQQAKTGQESGACADCPANARTRGGLVHVIDVGVLGADILVGDDADVVARHARLLDGIDGRTGLGVTIIGSANGFHL